MSELLIDAFSAVFIPWVIHDAAEHQVSVGVMDDVVLSTIADRLTELNYSSDVGANHHQGWLGELLKSSSPFPPGETEKVRETWENSCKGI